MSFKITCDSSADLTQELYKKHKIGVIPYTITMGDKDYTDGVDINTKMMFDFYNETKGLPKTSALNSYDYEEFFKAQNTEKEGIIHFCISSKISSTYNNAINAAENFENVYVIDSLSVSTGIGIQVLYACKLRDKGVPIAEAVELINNRRSNVSISFILDTLAFMHKGGRCSTLTLLGANMLGIKPSIAISDGRLGVDKKYMGKIHKVLEKYIQEKLNQYPDRDEDLCFLTYSTATDEMLDIARTNIKVNAKFKEVIETNTGSTVSTHCGPNTVGIIFYTNKDE